MQQSQCATSLIVQFANRLKALGRYDDAMIIVQADHGARFVVRRNKLVNVGGRGVYSNIWSRARSRALLLMKPPGQGAERTFRSSEIPASLLDIAATVRETLDLQGPRPTDGQNLLGPDSEISERKRYYHFFDKKGPEEWTDDMHRYEINGDRIKLLGIVKLENNPKPGMNND
jgi:arylsulfatase A-like enzyme